MNILDVIVPRRKARKVIIPAPVKEVTRVPPDARPKMVVYGKITRPGGSKDWNDPEFDFKLIAACLATESMFRRVVDKYVELIWKNGYKIIGYNPDAVLYIKSRIGQISRSTSTPFNIFLRDLSQQLVTYSNTFIEKVRSSDKKVRVNGVSKSPVIGYFIVDATSMKLAKGPNGRVLKYKQEIEGEGVTPEWTPENMVHIVKCREAGLTFGTPMVAPVLDDIRALRRMEENVEMLVFNYAIPLYQYKVGNEEHPADDYAIRQAESTIKEMPADGMLVTPWYHEVSAVGAEGRAIRMEGYLEYFRERIFSGLGTSAVSMGLGGGANRSTSEVLDRSMHITVMEFQEVISLYIQECLFNELLEEGGFDIGDERNLVRVFFPEVDLDAKIKLENHTMMMYQSNLITLEEARENLGKDPMTQEEYLDTYLFNSDLPKILAQSVDEPMLGSFGTGFMKRFAKYKPPAGVRAGASLNMPQNQYGVKMAPGTTKDAAVAIMNNDSESTREKVIRLSRLTNDLRYGDYYAKLKTHYSIFGNDVINLLRQPEGIQDVNSIAELHRSRCVEGMVSECEEFIYNALMTGASDVYDIQRSSNTYTPSEDVITYAIDKTREWLNSSTSYILGEALNTYTNSDITKVSSVFDIQSYRIRLGARNEMQRMYNIGYIAAGRMVGYTQFLIDSSESDSDGVCKQHEGKAYVIDGSVGWDDVPPGYMTHPLCTCKIRLRGG